MTTFDANTYFRNRLGTPDLTKGDAVSEAADRKLTDLAGIQAATASKTAQIQQRKAANEASLIGVLGLDPEELPGQAVNLAARGVAGLSKHVVGNLLALPSDIRSAGDTGRMTEEDYQAHTRYVQGVATADDIARLSTKDRFNNPRNETRLESFQSAAQSKEIAQGMRDTFNIDYITNKANTDVLEDQVREGFGESWGQVTGGWDKLTGSDAAGGAKDIASGLGQLIFNAGEAAADNPMAVTEYIAENLPQLALGMGGKAGTTLLTATNAGYAFDNYNQGVAKYKAENNGAHPPAELRQRMAAHAALLAVAEEIGDLSILKGAKAITEPTDAAARTALKRALSIPGAAIKATGTEALTEGVQTYAEGEATLKPASPEDIYLGAAIGGMTGGGMTGGLRGAAEAAAGAAEVVNAAAKPIVEKVTAKAAVDQAIASGDVTALLDPKSSVYDPAKAVAALMGNSALESATPEAKQANLAKAGEIVAELEKQKAEVEESIQKATGGMDTKAALAQAKAEKDADKVALIKEVMADEAGLKKRQTNIDRALTQITRFNEELNAGEVDVEAEVATITAADPVAAPRAADKVISLSMAIPERLDPEVATTLASNPSNGLTEGQRTYLRAFSAARVAENTLKTQKGVSEEIYAGGNGNVGISQYRSRIGAALAAGAQTVADQQLAVLRKFEASHKAKAEVVAKAWEQGRGTQIARTKDGQWAVSPVLRPYAEVRKNGGLTVNTADLVTATRAEADAITKTLGELEAAYAMKFSKTPATTTSGASNVQNVPEAHGEAASRAPAAAQQETTPVGSDQSGSAGSGRDEPAAGTPRVEADGVTQSTQKTSVDSGVSDADVKSSSAEGSSQSTNSSDQAAERASVEAEAETKQESVTETEASPESAEQTAEKAEPGIAEQLNAKYFTQSAGNETDSTKRPLVELKNFLSEGWEKVSEYLQSTESSEQILRVFKEKATAWAGAIQADLFRRPNQEFWEVDDLTQFLMKDVDGKLDLDENVKTALSYAAFSWVAENATRPAFNGPDEIREILGLDDTAIVEPEMTRTLSHVGTRQNVIINALGQRAVQALGIKATKDAPVDMLPKLEAAMGARAFKLLMDEGMLERTSIPGSVMADLTSSKDTDKEAKHLFVKLARKDGKLSPEAGAIYQATKGSKGALDKLFAVESGLKEPGRAPIPFTQTKTRNTDQGVPESLKNVVEQQNAGEYFVDGAAYDLFQHLDEEIVMEIVGAEHIESNVAHKANRPGLIAKNDGLRREIQRFKEFAAGLLAEDADMAMPLYFEHSVWKQQRVGIATNMVNPQTSKVHRHLLFRKSWETDVSRSDVAQMDNFRLRVAEGLGIKTDKQSNEVTLDRGGEDPKKHIYAKLNDPVIKAAVAAIQKRLAGQDLSQVEQEAVLAGVKAGGEKFHSLSALQALAEEARAIEDKKDSFKVRLMGEVDGVTNGPMLSHLLLGAAATAKDLFKLLNRGGFYEVGNEHNQYNLWREAAGHFDLYETTALHMTQAVQSMLDSKKKLAPVLDAIYGFTGTLADKDGKVLRDGRNIIKTPLTAMVFGSTVPSAVESMANNFVESIYAKIEDVSKSGTGLKTLLENLNMVLAHGGAPYLSSKMTIAELMEYEFKDEQLKGLKNAFKDTIGKAVESTMKTDFADYIAQRQQFNEAAQLAHGLYDAVYVGLREQLVAELVASGEIKVNATTGVPVHDLTPAQESTLRKRLAKMAPTLHTAMSKESGSLRAGLAIAKTGRKLSTKKPFEGNVKFATPFPDNKDKSVGIRGYETVSQGPGVAMAPMSVHSTDSAISHHAAAKGEVLNVHDAHGAGLATFEQTARNLNQATWESMLDYSPAAEMQAALSRTVMGLAALIEEGNLPPSVMENLSKVLGKMAAKKEIETTDVVDAVMQGMKDSAYKADSIKLEVLSQLQSIDQYALEGGNYEVTDGDREAAAKRKAELSNGLTSQEKEAIEKIKAVLQKGTNVPKEATPLEEDVLPKVSPFGQLGSPLVAADMQLHGFFAEQPARTAQETIKFLYRKLSQVKGRTNEFNLELLRKLVKLVPADLRVEMITDKTTGKTITPPTGPSFGWFTPNGKYKGVFLMGPQFKNSGLTDEVVIHELLHAALFHQVEANPNDPMVKELEQLRQKAIDYAKQQGLDFEGPLSNVHEFISWGMTNQAFQRQVLNQISMESKTGGLVNGVKALIERLVGILFKGSTKSQEQIATSGLTVLISNVSGLMAAANQAKVYNSSSKVDNNTPLSMAVPDPVGTLNTYSTMDIHNALSSGDNSPSFDAQLRNVLGSIVEKLHGPFGAFKASLMQDQALTPMDVWLKALNTGVAPFASSVQVSPLKVSQQEAHAMEQVEATMREVLSRNEVTAKTVYKELDKLYSEMYAKIKPSDFASQDEYDFIFKLDGGADAKSHHLARFAAFGLAHEQFNKMLQVNTAVDTRRALTASTFAERLQIIFEQVLEFFHTKITHTYGGQRADTKLNTLVSQLVDIEAKKRVMLARRDAGDTPLAGVEAAVKKAGENIRAGVAKAAGSEFVRKHNSPFVQAAGGLVRNYANDQVEWLLKGVSEFRNQNIKGKYGIAMGMLTDIQGPGKMLNALMLASTNSQRQRKQIISHTASVALQAFANEGKDLDKQAKASISSVFLRTGLHVLMDQFNMTQLEDLLVNKAAVDGAIAELESQLNGAIKFKDYFIHQANALAYFKVTGRVRHEKLMMNAHNIARMYGTSQTNQITEAQAKQAEAIIEKLVALYSLGYMDSKQLSAAKQVLNSENARTDGKGNGVEFVMALHKRLEQESKDRLFQGQQALTMHGYTPEIYNPHTEVLVANEIDGAQLELQGYTKGANLQQDPADPDQDKKHLYVLKDGGLQPFLTGIMSYTGKSAKGSKKHSGYMNVNTADGLLNASLHNDINTHVSKTGPLASGPRPDLSKAKTNYLAPVVNPQGEIVNWRYLMAESTKDSVLERDNRFEKVLGMLAGSIYDKETTTELNTKAITALHEVYTSEKATNPDAFMLVSPKSPDADMREVWGMLPDDTKAAVRKVWGLDGMYVRKDALTITFGYRKQSLAEVFDKDPAARNALEKLFVAIMENVLSTVARVRDPSMTFQQAEDYAKRAAVVVTKGERAWQELVHEVKDILVVKTGTVMMGNVWSNLSLLMIAGVPMTDILKNHLVALRGARTYQADTEELARLQAKVDTGLTLGQAGEVNRQIARLKDSLARNPVKELIDAGLMPTIVEDVAQDDDIYSYKGMLVRNTEEFTNKLNPKVVTGAKNVYMAHDTRIYQGLSRITQVSDFVARYTLYQHLTNRKDKPLSKEDAVFEASETFVNYDIPMHKGMQYLDDMGITMFTKYFIRIQRVLLKLTRENPARVLMTIALNNVHELGPIVLDGSAMTRIGNNPFGLGALQLPSTLDELATISTAMALVK